MTKKYISATVYTSVALPQTELDSGTTGVSGSYESGRAERWEEYAAAGGFRAQIKDVCDSRVMCLLAREDVAMYSLRGKTVCVPHTDSVLARKKNRILLL